MPILNIDLSLPALWDLDQMKREVDEYDPRINKPYCEMTLIERFKEYYQWVRDNPLVSKYQLYVINQILDHVNGTRVWRLKTEIKERYNLSNKNVKLLTTHILFDNRFCYIEKCERKQDRWLVFRSPKKKPVTMPKPIFKSGFINLSRQNAVA